MASLRLDFSDLNTPVPDNTALRSEIADIQDALAILTGKYPSQRHRLTFSAPPYQNEVTNKKAVSK
jgi:hypothetical protein